MKKAIFYLFAGFITLQVHAQKDSIATGNKAAKQEQADQVYTIVEQQPAFPGGLAALESYIHNNVRCPGEAIQQSLSGKVFVRFVVTQIGTIQDVEVMKSIADCKTCDDAAVQVIEHMPAWKPGKMNGENVKVLYNLPVTFRCE